MLLKALVGLSLDGDASESSLPRFYSLQRVGYRLDLDREGRPLGPLQTAVHPANPKLGTELAIPWVSRTSSVRPFLVDKGDYLFGRQLPGKTEQRAASAHAAFIGLVSNAATETGDADLAAIVRFVTEHLDEVELPEGYDPTKFVAVFVEGRFPTDNPAVQSWWAAKQLETKRIHETATVRPCAVCGRACEPVETVPTSIRGLGTIGGKATMGLVTGNTDVFERHGMKRAAGASLCLSCGERSHQALNSLIADSRRSRVLGQSKVLWWATEPCDDLLAAIVGGDTDESVGEFLDVLRGGGRKAVPTTARFYAVTIGANVNRVVVRDWIDSSLTAAVDAVSSWIKAVQIVGHDGSTVRIPGIFSLLAGAAPPGRGSPLSRVSPLLADKVLRAALTRAPLPPPLLAQCLLRVRSEQGEITVPRASILKACLTTLNPEEAPMTFLDTESTDTAYRCGRLLAVLDSAARAATSAKNDLVDRSYAAASTTPAATFPRLLKLHRAHVNKLRRDKPGMANRVQLDVEQVLEGLREVPAMFGPTEQARFALGLYHQQAADRARRSLALASRSTESDHEAHEEEATDDNE